MKPTLWQTKNRGNLMYRVAHVVSHHKLYPNRKLK